jgi:hypothetical protein
MKFKLLLFSIFIIIFLSFNVQAQIEKGSKMVGGYGYAVLRNPFYLNISPNIGYFISNRVVLGSSVDIKFSGYKNYSNLGIAVAPFTRYYFGKGDTRLFALASLGYRRDWYRYDEGPSSSRSSNGNVSGNLGLGLTHLITEQIGLEAILDLKGINIGFQIYIPSIKK